MDARAQNEATARGWRFEPSRYTTAYLLTGITEEQVQAGVVARLRGAGWEVQVVDAGARLLRGRAFGALRRAGVRDASAALAGMTGVGSSGLADVLAVKAGRVGFFECKKPGRWKVGASGRLIQDLEPGQLTEQQIDFLSRMARAGAIAGPVWCPTDADLVISTGVGSGRP